LGGILIGLFGVVPLYVFDAVTFLLVAIALATMRSRPVIPDSLSRGMQAVKEGLRFLWATPILLGIMVLDFVATFFGFNSVLMPIFADEVLGGGPQTLGLLLAAPAIGAVVGSTVMAGIRLPDRAGRGVLLAIAVYGVCILGFGLSTVLVVSLLFLAGSGAADAVRKAFRHTIRNEVTPSDLRGRIAAAYSTFAIGGPQLGEFEAGVLAALIGAPMAVAVGGIGVLASVATVWLKVPTIARYSTWKDETLLEAAIEPEK
ncbi:MAG: MFS transporter, partial [Chloroflexota bacterium]